MTKSFGGDVVGIRASFFNVFLEMKAAQQNSPCAKTLNQLTVEQRKKLFYDYASHYTDRFRSGIDFQYAEKPRQVIGLFILFLSIGFLGFMSEKWDTYYLLSPSNATRGALLGVYCTLLIYCFLQVFFCFVCTAQKRTVQDIVMLFC